MTSQSSHAALTKYYGFCFNLIRDVFSHVIILSGGPCFLIKVKEGWTHSHQVP